MMPKLRLPTLIKIQSILKEFPEKIYLKSHRRIILQFVQLYGFLLKVIEKRPNTIKHKAADNIATNPPHFAYMHLKSSDTDFCGKDEQRISNLLTFL